MNTAAVLLAFAGLGVTLATIILYLRTIPRGTVPEKVGAFALKLAVGVGLAAVAIFLGVTGAGWAGALVYVPAGLAILLGAFFLWLLPQRKLPLGDITVKTGDRMLPFSATTSEGAAFHSDALAGKRVLLKFFRGGWCPYCAAELTAFEDMWDEFAEHGVTLLALSKDTPQDAAAHKARDALRMTLLSDPKLAVIRAYGVEHHKAFGQNSVPKTTLGGVPIGLAPFSFRAMAIPTTLLIDEAGIIRWIDQTEDYRLRSSKARVMNAVKETFGSSVPAPSLAAGE
ncbi:MAG: peroxiredoxin family protein [Pseudomonadota bacterium]